MRMTRQVTRQKKIFPHPKNSFSRGTKSCDYPKSTRKQELQGTCKPEASNRRITGQPVARGPKQLETRRKSPGNVQPNPKANLFCSRFPTRAIHRSRRTGMRHAPYFLPVSWRDPAFLPPHGPRFYELGSTRRTARGKSNRLASEVTAPAASRVCPSRHAARDCARHNRLSRPTVSTASLHCLSTLHSSLAGCANAGQ